MTKALLFLALLAVLPLHAQERVLVFHSDIGISRDGALEVTERIAVLVEGRAIRRGILRDFPTEYRDRLGNKVSVPLEVLRVMRNGHPEPFSLEALANGTRIRIGRGDALLEHGRQTYEISYRTRRQVGFFERHDELYWNVNGTGWTLAFDHIWAEVRLPAAVSAREIKLEAYTGPQGARGRGYEALAGDGAATFRSTGRFAPGEGMTIVVGFPKGIVAEPTFAQRAGWFMDANRGVAAGIAGYLVLLGFLLLCWALVGRDPKSGPAFPRYEAPAGHGPASVRYLDRKGYDDRCLAAALLGLASRGYARIRQDKGYVVERTGRAARIAPDEELLASSIFSGAGQAFAFSSTYDADVQRVRDGFAQRLAALVGQGHHSHNIWPAVLAVVIGFAVFGAMFALAAPAWTIAVAIVAMLATVMLFGAQLLPAHSVRGRKLQDEIDGLRLYLSVAEKDDLARMKAPPQTKEEFSRMLPYALALGVEKTWADRFAATLGAAAVAAAVADYYSSDSDRGEGIESFTRSLSSLGDTVAAASRPPGSSSGFSDSGGGSSSSSGSGGSSGGGGGGGGGSGW